MHEDAIIANRRRVLEHVSVVLPGRIESGKETHDLLASVARPGLREPANRVVVAVGLPEFVDQGLDGFASPHSLFGALQVARTISTFSCDIARSVSRGRVG
jgi:hypothetical protein